MGQSQEKITFLQQLLHLARLLVLAPTTVAASWSNGPSYCPGFHSCLMCLDSCVLLLMKVSLFSSCHATFFPFYLFYIHVVFLRATLRHHHHNHTTIIAAAAQKYFFGNNTHGGDCDARRRTLGSRLEKVLSFSEIHSWFRPQYAAGALW